jgi:hypothetical protein
VVLFLSKYSEYLNFKAFSNFYLWKWITKKLHPIKVFCKLPSFGAAFGSVATIFWKQEFSSTERSFYQKNGSILKVSNVLSDLYKTESLARIAIQSELKRFQKLCCRLQRWKLTLIPWKRRFLLHIKSHLLDSVGFIIKKIRTFSN